MSKIYSIKYLFTDGITEYSEESYTIKVDSEGLNSWVSVKVKGQENRPGVLLYLNKDGFLNRPDAVNAAIAMKYNKIKSLKKQISKIEALKFE